MDRSKTKTKIEINTLGEGFLVLEKPSGMETTKSKTGGNNSVEDWLLKEYDWAKGVERSGIVHRLDKNTSGLLLVAKNEQTRERLMGYFKQRKVKKWYIALVSGRLPFDGEIVAPIGKDGVRWVRRKVIVGGKYAKSSFKVIGRYKLENKDYSLIEVQIFTGRTHQIRVHLSYYNWPLVGDTLYGGEKSELEGQFLHAAKLEIPKEDGGSYIFTSKLPIELEEKLGCYEKV